MANNVFAGRPNAIVAKSTISFASAGITALNTLIIYLVDNPLKSYVPGRAINGISGFETNKGYYMIPLQDMDLTTIAVPPVDGLTQLATPGTFTATPGDTQVVLDWANVVSATSYTVDRATNVGFTTGVSLNIYTGSTSGYNDTGRTNGVQYFYRVRAIAAGFADSAYATANATPVTSGGLIDLTFGTAAGTLNNSSGVWTTSVGSSGWDVNKGLSALKLPAATDGWIQMAITASDALSAMLAFNTTNANDNFSGYEAGVFILPVSREIYWIDAGAPSSNGTTVANGDLVRINRTGSTLKLQKSTNGGGSWTDVHTYTTASGADLFINININDSGDGGTSAVGKMYNPRGSNVS